VLEKAPLLSILEDTGHHVMEIKTEVVWRVIFKRKKPALLHTKWLVVHIPLR
jgi:hypothetical protein